MKSRTILIGPHYNFKNPIRWVEALCSSNRTLVTDVQNFKTIKNNFCRLNNFDRDIIIKTITIQKKFEKMYDIIGRKVIIKTL